MFVDKATKAPLPRVTFESAQVKVAIFYGRVARVEITQIFANVGGKPVETIFTFPIPTGGAVCEFSASIAGKLIAAEIHEKEQAFIKYDDAIAQGSTAMVGEHSLDNFHLNIGNFPPKQMAITKIVYICELASNDGNCSYTLPKFRQAPKKKMVLLPVKVYGIKSSQIKSLSYPISVIDKDKHAEVKVNGEVKNEKPFSFAFTRENVPLLETANLQDPKYRHALALPIEIVGEKTSSESYEFVFLLDCSGSMDGSNITEAKRALKLFVQSLPFKCRFNIIKFGSNYRSYKENQSSILNQQELEGAKKFIDAASADLGGTNIYAPIRDLFSTMYKASKLQKVLFVLTDGEVENKETIIDLVAKQKDWRVFTVGIGHNVDKHLVKNLASAAHGESCLVQNVSDGMQAKVLRLLKAAMNVYADNVLVTLKDPQGSMAITETIERLHMNEKKTNYFFMEEVPAGPLVIELKCTLSTGVEYKKETEIKQETIEKFSGSTLHSLAAVRHLKNLEKTHSENRSEELRQDIVRLSKMFSVLCNHTAFVLVEKNDKEVVFDTMELQEEVEQELVILREKKEIVYTTYEQVFITPGHSLSYIPPANSTLEPPKTREELVYMAKLAEQGERYKDMVQYMTTLLKSDPNIHLTVEELNLLSVAYKNKASDTRVAHRVYKSFLEKATEPKQKEALQRKIAKLEGEMSQMSSEVVGLVENALSANPIDEAKVFLLKMKGDYYRMLCEFHTPVPQALSDQALATYREAIKLSAKEMPPTHPYRLGLALNYSVFVADILNDKERAAEIAKAAFDDGISELDTLSEDSYTDATLIMQLLRDNLTLYTSDDAEKEIDNGDNNMNDEEPSSAGEGAENAPNVDNKIDLDKILFLQTAQGSWEKSQQLLDLLHLVDGKLNLKPNEISEEQWITALVIVFLQTFYAQSKAEWELICEKAIQFLEESGANVDTLLAAAKAATCTN